MVHPRNLHLPTIQQTSQVLHGTRTLDTADKGNLAEMLSALGPLRRILDSLLSLIEKLMATLRL
jgi:hypothetical protein